MLRATVITFAAVAALALGATSGAHAMARGGFGGGFAHNGFGQMSGFGHVGFGGGDFSHAGFGPFGGLGHVSFAQPDRFGHFGAARPFALHSNRLIFRHRSAIRRQFFGRHFVFVGASLQYYGSCFERIWTRWGWRSINICY
jgi:hypothetical protein